MTIHPILQSSGAMIGGLVTLGLFIYNFATLFTRNDHSSGCSIQ